MDKIKIPSENNKTENEYLEICNDFKKRMKIKNDKIEKLMKILFTVYGFIRRASETDEMMLVDECRSFISEVFDEEFGWGSD